MWPSLSHISSQPWTHTILSAAQGVVPSAERGLQRASWSRHALCRAGRAQPRGRWGSQGPTGEGAEGRAPCLQGQTALTQAPGPQHPHSHPRPRAPAQQPTDGPHPCAGRAAPGRNTSPHNTGQGTPSKEGSQQQSSCRLFGGCYHTTGSGASQPGPPPGSVTSKRKRLGLPQPRASSI